MSPFVFMVFPLPVGLIVGIFFSLYRFRQAEAQYSIVKSKLSNLIEGDPSKLIERSDDVIKLFEQYRYELIHRSKDELVFRYKTLSLPMSWEFLFWLVSLFSLGFFFLGFLFSSYLTDCLKRNSNQIVTLRLTW